MGHPADDLYDNVDSKLRYEAYRCDYLRYEAYSRLQAAAVAFGESLPIPEIVAIGGQSDGKSSLLEAFLGFRFNVREVEMGTRRPLIVQMVHDPTATAPRCRLQEENSDEYGPVIPETEIAEAIRDRTESLLRRLNATVSEKAIVMRAEFAFCPNLTIIDTPGFILKARREDNDTTPDDIMEMVKAQAAPQHRLILFLQQSSVEWASSLWLHAVQEVDPTFSRTVVVASKFDNRLKEFSEKWEVDRYLSAAGYLANNVKPFFVALPKERNITTSAEFRYQIQEVDDSVMKHLKEGIVGGFDEDKFGSRIGFANLRTYLEEELAKRYRESAPATLSLLQERCEAVAAELVAAESALAAAEDVAALRRGAMTHVAGISGRITSLLDGAGDCDPEVHGQTTDEERVSCRANTWPGVKGSAKPANANLRLYGGAAFERCIEEFQQAVKSLEFPAIAKDKVANVLLAQKSRGQSAFGGPSASEDIARTAARQLLAPLLETACARLAAVLRRVFDVAVERAQAEAAQSEEMLRPYVAFHAALRSAYQTFVGRLEDRTRGLVLHHLEATTSEWSMGLLGSSWGGEMEEHSGATSNHQKGDLMDTSDDREPIPESQMSIPETPSPGQATNGVGGIMRKAQRPGAPSGHSSDSAASYHDVCTQAERLFGRIRQVVAFQATPSTLKSAFLDPVRQDLTTAVNIDMFARTDEDFMGMFSASGAIAALESRRDALGRRVEGLVKCKNEFQELARCL